MSTSLGLSMFDGYQFKNFTNIDIPNNSRQINIRGAGNISEDQFQNLIILPYENQNRLEIFNYHTFKSIEISLVENEKIQGDVQTTYTNPLDHCYILSKNESQFFLYKINNLSLIHI